jgi:peptidoglycan L-alanyl-D-glutamate endopeptidase CwlK
MNQHFERLDGINNTVKDAFLKAVDVIKKELNITILVVEGVRSVERQAMLYRQGRSIDEINAAKNKLVNLGKPDYAAIIDKVGPQNGKKVTNSLPGTSIHTFGYAIDYAILNSDGSVDWDSMNLYKSCGYIFQKFGFNCGVFWTNFVDAPHIEMTANLKWTDFLAGKRPIL